MQGKKDKLAKEEEERTAKRRAKRQKKKVPVFVLFTHVYPFMGRTSINS